MANYDFHELSSLDFEELVRDLLQAEWGVRIESFKTGADSGIDLRHAVDLSSGTIIQCKHYGISGISKLLSALRKSEASKVSKLSPGRYVLATSVGLTPANKVEIAGIFSPFIKKPGDILGKDDLNNLILQHPTVEQRNFKLWLTSAAVLERVIHNAERCQTDFELDRVRKKIRLYVQNNAYPRAIDILSESRIVVISGAPGIGKTTLAEMLLYEHLERGYEPVVVRSDIVEAKRLYKRGTKQVFYFDDFLGQTFLRDQTGFLLRNQDAILVDFIEMIRNSKTCRFVMTTREHILQGALLYSEKLRHSPLLQHHCVIELKDYSLYQKGRILYNHLYFSDLPDKYKQALLEDEFYLSAIKHPNFNPRLIEWLSSYNRVKATRSDDYRLLFSSVLDRPEEIWRHAFESQISEASRNIVPALYTLGGKASIEALEKAWFHHHRCMATKYMFQTSPDEFTRALKELDGAFLVLKFGYAEFLNPSVKDFLSSLLSNNPQRAIDLMETAQQFEQASRLWNLTTATGAEGLQRALLSREEVVRTVVQRLLPETILAESVVHGQRTYRGDAPIETKATLLVQIADAYRTEKTMDLLRSGLDSVLERWENYTPEFPEAVSLVTALGNASWSQISTKRLYEPLKQKLLSEYSNAAWSDDFVALSEQGLSWQHWSNQDMDTVQAAFRNYLENGFWEEISENRTSDELGSLSGRIESIGEALELDVRRAIESIDDEIAEAQSKEQDSWDRDSDWRGGGGGTGTDHDEAEVRRMFGSLIE